MVNSEEGMSQEMTEMLHSMMWHDKKEYDDRKAAAEERGESFVEADEVTGSEVKPTFGEKTYAVPLDVHHPTANETATNVSGEELVKGKRWTLRQVLACAWMYGSEVEKVRGRLAKTLLPASKRAAIPVTKRHAIPAGRTHQVSAKDKHYLNVDNPTLEYGHGRKVHSFRRIRKVHSSRRIGLRHLGGGRKNAAPLRAKFHATLAAGGHRILERTYGVRDSAKRHQPDRRMEALVNNGGASGPTYGNVRWY